MIGVITHYTALFTCLSRRAGLNFTHLDKERRDRDRQTLETFEFCPASGSGVPAATRVVSL